MTKKKKKLLATKKAEQKLKKETWNIDINLIDYLYIHLVAYKKYTNGIIDLSYHTFMYNNNMYTLDELITKMIELCIKLQGNKFATETYKLEEYANCCKQLCDILGLILPYLWW